MDKPILRPVSDLIFKKIFGDTKNSDVLIDFLQSVLDLPESEYGEIEIADPNFRVEDEGNDKIGILDIKLYTSMKKIIDVEIQLAQISEVRERIIFYLSKMITEQIRSGESYEVIQKVISILITDYKFVTENNYYHNRYMMYDPETKSRFSDIIEINVLELPKIPERTDKTKLWDWLKFLKVKEAGDLETLNTGNSAIKRAAAVLMELSQDERTRMLYDAREKAWRDEQARLRYALQQGREEGREEGRAEGLAEGRAEGRANIAKRLLRNGLRADEVSEITDLPIQKIEELLAQLN